MRKFYPLLLATLASCSQPPDKPVAPVSQSHELVVLTRAGATTFYRNADGQYAGLEYDLVKMFAQELGVPVKFVIVPKFSEILPALAKHRAHFAAAGLSINPAWESQVNFAAPYQTVQEKVVYNTDSPKPESLRDLVGKKIEVVAGSSYVERLKEAQRKFPGLLWSEIPGHDSIDLLGRVAEGTVDYVIADSHIVDLARNFYPALGTAFDLGSPEALAWAFPKDGDPALLARAQEFFARIARDGTLRRLLDRYYGHLKRLDQLDVANFLEKMRTVLPRFRGSFQEAQELTGIDWRLLAALGFQESHWDPLATSPTGVRGLMMLTEDTADRMQMANRLDPREAILAGARYFLSLKDMLPGRIPEPDRTWMTIAAYNVGFGHLEDARILAQRERLSPDAWVNVKKTLPLLARSKFFTTVKRGFARGGEPVIMTENVRTYYDILRRFEPPYKPGFPSLDLNISVSREIPTARAASLALSER